MTSRAPTVSSYATPFQAQMRASRPDACVWVSASAGSGKTKVLADRVLRLLLAGAQPGRILCLTFTRAGAAEMQNRVRERLAEWAIASDENLSRNILALTGQSADAAELEFARSLFASVLDTPGGMKIQTIHAFCESILGRFPIEAGVAPHFSVMDARSSRETLKATRNEVLGQAWLEEDSPLAHSVRVITGWLNENQFAAIMQEIISSRGRINRLVEAHGDLARTFSDLRDSLDIEVGETEDALLKSACSDENVDEDGLRLAIEAMKRGSAEDGRKASLIEAWLDNKAGRVDGFSNYAKAFLTSTGQMRKRLVTKSVEERFPRAFSIISQEAGRVEDIVLKRNALRTAEATEAILTITTAITERFDAYKRRHALLDYDDLILKARELLERAAPWVLFKLDGGLDHVLIDEAQDSNADQWAVVRAITAEFFAGEGSTQRRRTVFAVGDEKQSIFRFQGASPDEFARMSRYFEEKCRDAQMDWLQVPLDVSFRSTESVLRAVDAVFDTTSVREGVSAAPIRHRAFRLTQAGQVELWPPVEPAPRKKSPLWTGPVNVKDTVTPAQNLARKIAERIRSWMADGEKLESAGRSIRPGDIMILVRRRSEIVSHLIRELRNRGIDVAGVDRMALNSQLAVWDVLSVARFTLLPEDSLNLTAILKGPFIGFNEQQIFDICHGRGSKSVWQSLQSRADEASKEAVEFLREAMRQADMNLPYEFFAHVLGSMEGRKRIIERLGDEANDPIDELLALSLSYERMNAPSMTGFLRWFEQGETEVVRDMSHAVRDEVRILTVHGAKGLQAPIVFLADTMQEPPAPTGLMWTRERPGEVPLMLWTPRSSLRTPLAEALLEEEKERQAEEYRRLLYVAMTRAEDRLYIYGYAGRRRSKQPWYKIMKDGLEEVAERFEVSSEPAAGDEKPSNVWGLSLSNKQTSEPDRRTQEETEPDHQPALPDWARKPAPNETSAPGYVSASRLEELDTDIGSPSAGGGAQDFQHGHLIRKLLRYLPGADERQWRDLAQQFLERQIRRLDPGTAQFIVDKTLAVLERPEFRPIFARDALTDVPVIGRIDDAQHSGLIDRLIVSPGSVRTVDFVTNRPSPPDPTNISSGFLRQMAAYRIILSRIYKGRRIECSILWTDGPVLMDLHREQFDPT